MHKKQGVGTDTQNRFLKMGCSVKINNRNVHNKFAEYGIVYCRIGKCFTFILKKKRYFEW
jgi:hypothetical protein